MILGFKKQFVRPILAGTKIHTIRRDAHSRWYPGRNIQFATGSRTKNYNEFKRDICRGVQRILILPDTNWVSVIPDTGIVKILDDKEMLALAQNDGFDTLAEFWAFFSEDFDGIIIHWTDFKY